MVPFEFNQSANGRRPTLVKRWVMTKRRVPTDHFTENVIDAVLQIRHHQIDTYFLLRLIFQIGLQEVLNEFRFAIEQEVHFAAKFVWKAIRPLTWLDERLIRRCTPHSA